MVEVLSVVSWWVGVLCASYLLVSLDGHLLKDAQCNDGVCRLRPFFAVIVFGLG